MQHDSLANILRERFAAAIGTVANRPPAQIDAALRRAGDARFGDYQCNAAMSLARQLKAKPREVAERIVAAAQPSLDELAEPLEIAGPGFINIRLKSEFLSRYLAEIPPPPPSEPRAPATGPPQSEPEAQAMVSAARPETRGATDQVADRVGLPPVEQPGCVVIDYSQPNIAKQMHVGHLRSTIIGDVFARVLAFEGHKVIRQNHIGDWGTQFGVLIRYYREHPLPTPETHDDVLEAIAADYQAATARFNTDERFATEARRAVTELQSGEPEARRLWEQMCAVSWQAFTEVYERLGALLRPSDVRGESFYNDRLQPLVDELREQLAPGTVAAGGASTARAEVREDQGAVCVFLYDANGEPQFKNPDGEMLPVIIQKSDGAFLYATTDLAAIRFRIQELGATRVIYVTDARQKLHFEMFFAIARAAGWITDAVQVEHVTFGTVMGPNRKPLKTREGTPVTLRELLAEAEKRAYGLLQEREAESDEAAKRRSDGGEPEWQTGGGTVGRSVAATASAAVEPGAKAALRVHNLAKELGVTSRAIIDRCRAQGVDLKNHMAVISASLAESIRRWFRDARDVEYLAGRLRIPASWIDLDKPLLDTSDPHSLDAVERVMALEDLLEASAPEQIADRFATWRDLARYLAQGGPPDRGGTKPTGITGDEKREIARRVGIAAVKYADLRNDRQSDYVFSWDKMISFQGNTAPYMMYAYARIRSIYRKAAERFGSPDVYAGHVSLTIAEPTERALALRLARLRETIDAVAADLEPHTLCTYLYELAGDFMRFYESCPVLQAPDESTRQSRMRLCDITARTLKLGLWLLGIETIERM